MAGEWLNALMRAPDPGTSFVNAYNSARERRQQDEVRREERQWKMEDRQRQATQDHQKVLDANREKIVRGAELFRTFKAKNPNVPDEQIYEMMLPTLQQAGIDTSTLPQPGSPEVGKFVGSALAIADAWGKKPDQTQDPPNIREYEYAKTQGFRGSYMDFMEHKRGPIVANNGDGTFTIIPRNSPQPADDDEWEIIQPNGGQTPQASGNFRP